MVTNLVTGTITSTYRTSGIQITGLDFTPTNGFVILKSSPNRLTSGNASYADGRIAAVGNIGCQEAKVYDEYNYWEASFQTGSGNKIMTCSSNGISWINNTGSTYDFYGGTYFYVVWREE